MDRLGRRKEGNSMNGEESAGTVWSVLVAVIVACVLGGAVFLWYAAGLFRIFRRLNGESWRAWVPVVNEAELFRLGGRRSWEVLFWFIPVLNLYALYLHIRAVHVISQSFGRGAGSTVLGVLVPPVWSSVLGWSAERTSERPTSVGVVTPGGPPAVGTERTGAPQPVHALRPDSLEPAVAAPPAPAAPVPEPVVMPAAAPVAAPVEQPFAPAAPSAAPPVAPPAAPPASPPKPLTPPSVPEPSTADAAPSPWAPVDDRTVARPVTGAIELAGLMAGDEATIHGTELRSPAVEEDLESTRVVQREPLPEEVEETVIVRPRRRTTWELVTDQDAVYRLEAQTVVIGRSPVGEEPGIQYLAVQDASRTLSKHHAVLELVDGRWMITDLQSTNGVTLLDGALETRVEPGQAVPVEGPLLIGRLRLDLREVDA